MNARVGLDIGGTKTAVLIVDEAGQALGEFVQPTDVATPERLVAGVVAAVDRALTTAGTTRQSLLAAGVGVPGRETQCMPADLWVSRSNTCRGRPFNARRT